MLAHKGVWLLGALLLVAVIALAYIQTQQRSPLTTTNEPHSIVTNFKEDAKSTRSFTWYTNSSNSATLLQIVKGTSRAANFDEQDILRFTGTTTTIKTGDKSIQGVHKVNATGLEPGTRYTYRVGTGKGTDWSEPAEFVTEAANTTDFTFINVADSQGISKQDFEVWGQTLSKAFHTFPEANFIVHNGDLVEDPEVEQSWDYFFGYAKKWLTSYPLMPVTGNHDEVEGNAARFVSHFNLPDNAAKGSTPGTNYSFDYGTAHFVFLNTESNKKKQKEWLLEDLSGTKQPWIIVALHQGPYGGKQEDSIIKQWVPLFDQFKVDLVLQGHNHEYSRSYPLKDGQITTQENGTVYVVTNTSGNKFNDKKADLFYHQVHFQNKKQMYSGIRINGDTLTYEAYDFDDVMLDNFVLQKPSVQNTM
ncbi:metallophosphoesterase [Cohnella sp. WQ 127256]|uniref:metallophosphoesterase n=1 Tax=Cohnella sp. WQ 127256 TaxID=2938790 RepID=UPI002119565E|nr:metallophosphoesterase [Cohnella sp. WQ 127256]